MSRADICIPRILEHEGGFVDPPDDPGGATNKGITLDTFRRYVRPGGTVADLKRLTTEQAVTVYRLRYWNAVQADRLPVGVDYAVADFAVNSGPSRAARMLQHALGVTADGVIGPRTLGAASLADPASLINELCDQRLVFMKSIRAGAAWKTFGRGWSRRVAGVRRDALADAAGFVRPDAPPPDPSPGPAPRTGLAALLARILALFKPS